MHDKNSPPWCYASELERDQVIKLECQSTILLLSDP